MKIDMKNKRKKVVVTIVIAALAIGAPIVVAHGQINEVQNNYTSCHSTLLNIKDNIFNDKKRLIDSEAKIQSMNPDKESLTELKIIIAEIENSDFKDTNNINKNVELSDKFNTELDKIIEIFKNNDAMKNDIELSNNMNSIESLNSLLDDLMEEYNTIYSQEFNGSIKKFPAKLLTNKKGWSNLDTFASIN